MENRFLIGNIVKILADGDIGIMETVKEINANTDYSYFTLRDKPELKDAAAEWFHSKWGVPKEAYLECMTAYLDGETENGWYLCLLGDRIAGGLGIIGAASAPPEVVREEIRKCKELTDRPFGVNVMLLNPLTLMSNSFPPF